MKRNITCGITPKITTFMNEAPVARTASICFIEISSMASVKSLPTKPIEATVRAMMPARAPKPTAFTQMMATITGWNERQAMMMMRTGQVMTGGNRLRAAKRPRGSEIRVPRNEARKAICSDSVRPLTRRSQRSKFGGNMRAMNFAPLSRPVMKRARLNSSELMAHSR